MGALGYDGLPVDENEDEDKLKEFLLSVL